MRYALVNEQRQEARRGLSGKCQFCGDRMVAKCGEIKIWHWAHFRRRTCDHWWENETEWHRAWKGQFPDDWQEVVLRADSGEKHIADVKTQTGWALEFQHSYLNPEERRSRNAFYPKLVWVVDGTRRKTDKPQFQKAIEESTIVWKEPLIRRVHFPEEYRLLKEWHDSNALVFFDFQEANETKQSKLWFLFPKISTAEVYLSTFSREDFVELHNNNKFDEIVRNIILPIRKILASNKQNVSNHPQRLPGFERHMANMRRRRRRF